MGSKARAVILPYPADITFPSLHVLAPQAPVLPSSISQCLKQTLQTVMSLIPYDFKSLKTVVVRMRNAAFAHGNVYLVFNGIDAFQIRKQQSPS